MYQKSAANLLRFAILALVSVSAILLALAIEIKKPAAAPAGPSTTTPGTKGQSRRAGSRGDSKVDAFLSQPSVRSSLDEIKLTDPAGEYFDRSGWTVAISGTTAVVGTVHRKVHIFVRRGDVWELQQTIPIVRNQKEDSDTAANPVAIDKETLVIGAYAAAHVYVRTGKTWSLQASLLSPEPTDDPFYGGSLGQAVGVSGDTIIVGAGGVDNQAGAVYFYERSGATWSGPLKVSANDRSPGPPNQRGDLFGWAVAIEGDTAVVTAPAQHVVETDDIIDEQGAAYVYVRSLGTWVEQGYLTPDEDVVETTDHMGAVVDLSRDTVVLGEENERAFVFARQGTSWREQQILTSFDGLSGDGFGNSVGISGDRIVIGSLGNDNELGAAYLYERTQATWFEGDKLRSTTGVPSYGHLLFGESVGISGETIIVGAPSEEIGLNSAQGAAYIFQKRDSDRDGLPDDWEKNGVTIAGVFIDLPKMGADPMHKDIFIHLDWMSPAPSGKHFEPNPRAIREVIDAFAVAPLDNPDRKPGINLHVDFGPASIMKYVDGASETWGELSRAGEVPYQAVIEDVGKDPPFNWPTVDAVKMVHFTPTRRKAIFHYALYCDSYRKAGDPPEKERRGGTSRGAPGTDFLLAIGSRSPNGEPTKEASLFMHEFGHKLGLLHGGGDDVNNKPNYISIMNYRFELIGTLNANGRQRHIDYSRATLDPLNENNLLSENVGINDPAMHLTTWNPRTRPDTPPGSNKCLQNPDFYYRRFYPSKALDWDCNGQVNSDKVTADINGDGELSLLTGFDDWPVLVFDAGGRIGNLEGTAAKKIDSTGVTKSDGMSASAQADTDELTIEELEALVPPALLAEESAAPLDLVTVSPQTGSAPLLVNFDGSASTAINGTIVDWAWDFGDGTTGSGVRVAHIYTVAGDYFARLTVTDNNGHVNLVPLLQRVTVTDDHPNLAPFRPPSWSDTIVVSTVAGTNTDSAALTTNDSLYVDSAVINNGTAPTAADFVTKLYVDGVEAQTFLAHPPLAVSSFTAVQDIAIGPLSAGQHTLKVVADANGAIVETDESDNEYSRVINITVATPTPTPTPTGQPNLTPYQPPGWSDKIVVSNVTGTNADNATLNTTDTLFVDWDAINSGGAPTTGAFETKLYVDGVEKNTRVTSQTINPGNSFGVQDITIGSLSAGQHAIRVVLDSGGAISETNEADNEYVKTISVLSPLPSPSPTPTPLPVSQTYTVRNTNDSGPDSLRQAISDANNHPNAVGGIDQIAFNIPGSGVHTITPTTAFPVISDVVLVDGYTQPGASANTQVTGNDAVLLIELNLVNLNSSTAGLNFTGGGSTLRGLVINNFNSQIAFASAIRLASSNNVLAGNFIGTNAAGTSMAPNFFGGITVDSGANNLIGGSVPADRNIIAGSATQSETARGAGIQINTTQPGTRIQGNYIGTNAAGNAALGHFWGINVEAKASSDITIGGLTDTPGMGVGNVISGNSSNGGIASDGIHILHRPRGDIRIQGNLVGLNATGTEALSNGVSGILIEDASPGTFTPDPTPGTGIILIGGTEPGARNVIFNNRISGIVISLGVFSSAASSIIRVQGNFIGTDITGTINPPIGVGSHSGGNGMTIYSDGSVTIGGNSAAARNVISCRGLGLLITGGGATVQGNYIGTAVDGISPLGNQFAGVRVEKDAVAIIGGTAPGQGNLIAHSFLAGIEVRNSARATILGNSIFDNGTLDVNSFQGHPGIDLNDNGVTPNDSCDTDSGPNGLQNYPALTSAVAVAGTIRFAGALNSKPATSFRVELFSNASCEASGNGEGQTYVGSTTVTTDDSCIAPINLTLASAVPVGQFITATATDPDGNTSEFGPCVRVTAASPTAANGSLSGRIIDTSGNPVAGVVINLTGTQNRLTITDENGRYNFDNVETIGFYTVVPSRANYSFSPEQKSFTALGSHTNEAFTATSTGGGMDPLNTAEYFVRQQYLDFLGREPDESGLNFWVNQIRGCENNAACLETRRINTSAAFFLSIEFQQTGYLVGRLYKSAYGNAIGNSTLGGTHQLGVPTVHLNEFLPDTQNIAQGVVVGKAGWEQVLENNKQAYIASFAQRSRFTTAFPLSLTPAQFVDALNANAGNPLSASERDQLVNDLSTGAKTRAQVLRAVAEDQDLVSGESNRAFVLMQFFGYLRRNPNNPPDTDYTGYDFWLTKLNQFGGNYQDAEMVKAFITSAEYRQRFGP